MPGCKNKMPRTRAEFDRAIENAFLAGCAWGYGVDHGCDMSEQEQLGVQWWLGRISQEEATRKRREIWEKEDC